jgi:hypothetical protein
MEAHHRAPTKGVTKAACSPSSSLLFMVTFFFLLVLAGVVTGLW